MVSPITLCKNGPAFSRFVVGLWRLAEWRFSADESLHFINACMDIGITTFDHANICGDYECEQLFGKALALSPSLRDKMQLVTKCDIKLVSSKHPQHTIAHYDTRKEHIVASAETSLQRLNTDHLDLLPSQARSAHEC